MALDCRSQFSAKPALHLVQIAQRHSLDVQREDVIALLAPFGQRDSRRIWLGQFRIDVGKTVILTNCDRTLVRGSYKFVRLCKRIVLHDELPLRCRLHVIYERASGPTFQLVMQACRESISDQFGCAPCRQYTDCTYGRRLCGPVCGGRQNEVNVRGLRRASARAHAAGKEKDYDPTHN